MAAHPTEERNPMPTHEERMRKLVRENERLRLRNATLAYEGKGDPVRFAELQEELGDVSRLRIEKRELMDRLARAEEANICLRQCSDVQVKAIARLKAERGESAVAKAPGVSRGVTIRCDSGWDD
jgi:hypothetical protein